MEDIFEAIIGIIVIALGIAAKASKNKKAQSAKKPQVSAWDELDESVEKRFAQLIGKHDGEPVIPYAPVQPAQPQQPAPPTPAQPIVEPLTVAPSAEPAVMAEPEMHFEGMPAETAPVPEPKPVFRIAEPVAEVEPERPATRRRLVPERITADTLRSAFVMSEVLGRPVALRNAARK